MYILYICYLRSLIIMLLVIYNEKAITISSILYRPKSLHIRFCSFQNNTCVMHHESSILCSHSQVSLSVVGRGVYDNSHTVLHRWELPCNYPVFYVVMVIYHYIERIWRILVTPNYSYNIYDHEKLLSR